MSLRKFINWLKGGPKLKDVIFKLEVFTRKLEYHKKQLEREARKNREEAKRYRMMGNNEAAKMYAEHYLRYQKWALATDSYRLRIHGMVVKLRQSQSVYEVASTLSGIRAALEGLKSTVNLPDISQLVDEIDASMQEFDIAQDVTEAGFERMTVSTDVTSKEVAETLSEIDQEIGVETGVKLPSVPAGKIAELEKDIKKLKEEL
ncbi:MAG: Snf7 family protein [Candidatus Freyarchaeota archaeon]|nr:Snf7 family protein [Candidatus Freyrarchaeum guaymaensis]